MPKGLLGSLVFNGRQDELRRSTRVNSRIRAGNNAELLCNGSSKGYETESSEGGQYLLVYCLTDVEMVAGHLPSSYPLPKALNRTFGKLEKVDHGKESQA